MSEDLEKAKEIFFDCGCNLMFLQRDGVAWGYYKFKVSKDLEKKWRQEYIEHWLSELQKGNIKAVNQLENAGAYEYSQQYYAMRNNGNYELKYRIAQMLFNLATKPLYVANQPDQSILEECKRLALKIHQEINNE